MVTVVDCGLGNLFSIQRAFGQLMIPTEITSDPERLSQAQYLVLPGVGAFGDGMKNLQARGLIEPIRRHARSGRPLIGICLGMQLLFTQSEEFGSHEGLGLIEGKVMRLQGRGRDGLPVKIPHVGWSELLLPDHRRSWDATVLEGAEGGQAMYFVHSYVPHPQDDSVTVAQMEYGGHRYCALVQRGAVVGCQFHPEKSGELGLALLRNWSAEEARC